MAAYPASYADLKLLIYIIYLFTCLLIFILKSVCLIISALHR